MSFAEKSKVTDSKAKPAFIAKAVLVIAIVVCIAFVWSTYTTEYVFGEDSQMWHKYLWKIVKIDPVKEVIYLPEGIGRNLCRTLVLSSPLILLCLFKRLAMRGDRLKTAILILAIAVFWGMTWVRGSVDVRNKYSNWDLAGVPCELSEADGKKMKTLDYSPFERRTEFIEQTPWIYAQNVRAPLPFIVSLDFGFGLGGGSRHYKICEFWFFGYTCRLIPL